MKLTDYLSFEESKRIVAAGYPNDIREDDGCYVIKAYKRESLVGPDIYCKVGDFDCYSYYGDYRAENLIPAPTYAEAIEWLVENGKMNMDWDFAKAVTDALGWYCTQKGIIEKYCTHFLFDKR